MSADAYIAEQRALLDRLELFLLTPEYERLRRTVQDSTSENPEPWLAEWLLSPAFGLGGKLPIDVVTEPDGIEQLIDLQNRIASGTGA